MARCGRCGMWAEYPHDHHEQKYEGVCMWFQLRLEQDQVWEKRECADFIERIPGMNPMEHFNFKATRDDMGSAHAEAKTARVRANASLAFSGIVAVATAIKEVFF